MPKPKVFLSYGRRDARDLAGKLLEALADNEFDPWQDTREIPAGSPWTEPIQQGLEDSSACVAILSPHSVRTKGSMGPGGEPQGDSVCLNEINAALQLNKAIVPAMAVPCAAPFLINHLDYVDLTGWKDSAAKLRDGIERLITGLKDALAGTVHYRPWYKHLRPIDFAAFLRSRREGFVGRKWLLDTILTWAVEGDGSTLLVVGDPGIGKSAIIAELVHRNPDGRVLAYHCCQANVGKTLDPGRFVRNLAAMIAGSIPAYAARLEEAGLRERLSDGACEKDPQSAFELGIIAPLADMAEPDDAPLLILVDALDEALLRKGTSGASIVDLLRNLYGTFPKWLRLVATTRKEKPVLEALAGFEPEIVKAGDPRNRKDIEDYARQRLNRQPLRGKLEASGRGDREIAELIRKGARGNFLYARHALDALELPGTAIEEVDTLPAGLANQYEWFFFRQYGTEAEFAPVKALLQTLVVTQRAVDDLELELMTGLPRETELAIGLRRLSAYIAQEKRNGEPRFRIFHRSLADWLTKSSRRGAIHSVSRLVGHADIAERLWRAYEDDPEDLGDYGLTHLATHLAEVARRGTKADAKQAVDRLADFVLDEEVQELRRDDPLGVVRSLELALEVASEQRRKDAVDRVARCAWGLATFRHTRLDARRLFEMARKGQLQRVEREVDLYPVQRPWREAALLTAAWWAANENEADARALRDRVAPFDDEPLLIDRLDAALDKQPHAAPAPLPPPEDEDIDSIMGQIRGTNLEYSSGVAEDIYVHEDPPPDQVAERPPNDDELPPLLARLHAPLLVAHAIHTKDAGTALLQEYIALHGANSYGIYRNRSLWPIFQAVLRHPDESWILQHLTASCLAAFAGGTPEFREAAPIALRALDSSDAARRVDFEASIHEALTKAKALQPFKEGGGDKWGAHRRRLGAYAETMALQLAEEATARGLITDALGLHYGYAGFNAPSCLTLAESARIAGCAPDVIHTALESAQSAAHNVQDPSFCLRTTSRCHALRRRWWPAEGEHFNGFDVPATVKRFVEDPMSAEFAAMHVVRWKYKGREDTRGKRGLPAWAEEASTLRELSVAYQHPLSGFLELNPDVDPDKPWAKGSEVCVPDPEFGALLAARLATELLVSDDGSATSRARLMQRLIPRAAGNETALDIILARLFLLAPPSNRGTVAKAHEAYRVAVEGE